MKHQKPLIALLLFLAFPSSFANTKWYKVELLAFSMPAQGSGVQEEWPDFPLPSLNKAQELLPNENHMFYKPYEMLPKKAFTLISEEEALEKQNGYQVLFHYAWLQKISEPIEATPIHLYGGKLTLNQQQKEMNMEMPPYASASQWKLDGFLTVSQGENNTFNVATHFNVNVMPYELNNGNKNNQPQRYSLLQTQDLSLNEAHYFDTPFFGLLVKISQFA